MNEHYLNVREAARYCMVSPETVRRWIRKDELKAYNTKGKGIIKIRLDDLKEFVSDHNILTSESFIVKPEPI